MGRTVRELLPVLTERELAEWAAFDLVEPIGGRRGDYQAGVVASTIANANRGKRGKAFSPTDFVPEYGAVAQELTLEHWLGQRMAQESWGPHDDSSGEVAAEGDDPGAHDGGQQLQRAGGDVDDGGNGVGGVDAAAGGDA